MAEDGHLQESDNTSTIQCRLLDCPICLEQMLQPKSLPCLHSFCEECLGTYIVTDLSGEMAAATSFPCPVCRKITSPVDPSETKETWARQFPSNSLVKYANIPHDTKQFCGLCKRTKNIDVLATYLCKQDDTLFCNSCKINAHDYLHKICDTVPIDDMALAPTFPNICSTHNEKMEWYCKDHKLIRCNKCIITEHRRCDAVMTVTEFCEKQTEHSNLYKIGLSLGMAVKCMELMIKTCDDRDESMKQNQDVGLKSISDLRRRIDAHLDKKQKEITQELISKCKAEKAKVDVTRQNCNRLKAAIQSTREASMTADKRKDHIKRIQLFHRGQTEIRACNDLIDELSSKSVTIKHDTDSVKFTQKSPMSLGQILVMEQPCNFPDGVEYIQSHDKLSYSGVKKLRQFDCATSGGVVLMSTGNIVVNDCNNNSLKLLSSQGECLSFLTINGTQSDVCLVEDSTVAVAASESYFSTGIHIVKVQDSVLTLSSVIRMKEKCHGITFVDGAFIVSTPKDVYRVGMDGKSQKVDQLPNNCYHLVSCPNQKGTFASLSTSKAIDAKAIDAVVTKLSTEVQTCIMRVGLVKNGMGIDMDRDGNLYVCGQRSNNVVQMSPDGTRIRELLTSKDGIDSPRAISVWGDKFVVTNESLENRNCIDVYQLF
ncbi:uncharacterized protein [Argopecten irradians]|uniref:uncharacterized protein n=1 Tax=Argopecten irradians TaxID=31199 RepID=UPI00371D5DC2